MEKKNTSPTVAEQKQILETCVHKLEEVNACILAMYPTLSTNLPLSDYTNEELIAHELCEDIFSDFIRYRQCFFLTLLEINKNIYLFT